MTNTREYLIYNICNEIIKNKNAETPLIVGLTGIDTSGKSKMAEELKKVFIQKNVEVQLVHVDDFHYPKSKRYNDSLSEPDQYYELSINFEAIRNNLLEPIKSSTQLEVTLPHLDLLTDSMSITKNYNITKDTIVLIEGVFLYREEVRPYIDFYIFLDIEEEVVIQRAEIRDVPVQGVEVLEKYHTKYLPAQRRYINKFQPNIVSNIVINNSDFENPQIKKWPHSSNSEVSQHE
ncbi:hypothetical protein [Paenibacillus kyungheensis]